MTPVEQIQAALAHYDLRIEISQAFNLSAGGTTSGVDLFTRDAGTKSYRRVPVPTLYPNAAQGRVELLRQLADLLEAAEMRTEVTP